MRKNILFAVALSLATGVAFSQVHPTLQRGFTPETSYEIGEIDAINLFNGSLTLTIPIGQRYPVGGEFTYGLTLVYSSVLWDYLIKENDLKPGCLVPEPEDDCWALGAKQSESSNAGLGWRLSFGDLYRDGLWPNTGGVGNWMYVAPDGSRHLLYPTLHEHESAQSDVLYSRDNTYLRMTETEFDIGGETTEAVLEHPDGTITTFTANHYPQRLVPTRIEDRFGNAINITYPTDGQGEIDRWVVTDSLGRVQQVYWTTVASERVVDRVELTSFDSVSPAVYVFTYDSSPTGTEIEETCKDRVYPLAEVVLVPLLVEVQRPDGTTFAMKDTSGSPAYYTENVKNVSQCDIPYTGILKRLVLPTGGVYEWDFGRYDYPAGSGTTGCNWGGDELLQTSLTYSAGVIERRITSAPGQTATWVYEPDPSVVQTDRTVVTTVTAPDGNEREHFFRTQACRYDSGGSGYDAWSGWDYGLPYSMDDPVNGRFKSTAIFEGSGTSHDIMRTRYVAYEHDQLPPLSSGFGWYDTNRRVASSSTVFNDDGSRQATNVSVDFDGLGHYRTRTRSGWVGTQSRTDTTNFNPDGGEYSINSSTNTYTGDFDLPNYFDPWIIGTYDATTQSAGGDTAAQEYCFDSEKGTLTKTRVLKNGTTRSASDILKVLAYDTSGNITSESLFGGDAQAVLDTNGLTSICALTPPEVPEYEQIHTYQYGVLATSKYDSDEEEMSTGDEFFTTDRTIDANTGLPSENRDVSGFETVFTYDAMGRVDEVAPDEGARVEVAYTAATDDVSKPGYAPAEIDIEYRDSLDALVAAEAFEYDGLGRIISQKRKMPDGTWSERLTEYTVMGWTYRVSEFDTEGTLSPNWTTYSSFDPFGRAGLVTRPDGTTTSFDFDGERVASQTVSIGTSTSGETQHTTTTYSDHLGRVTQVTEPLSVTSNYQYDVGGRLEQVDVVTPGGTQTRTFDYDNRGFLTSETMPEKNGAVSYSFYNTMGSVGRLVDGPSDLWIEYDGAGRVVAVEAEASCGSFTVKSFAYGQANSTGDNVLGKLQSATAFNYLTDLESICSSSSKVFGDLIFSDGFESGDTSAWSFILTGTDTFAITQTYVYGGLGGRVSELTTTAGGDVFTQGFNWTDLGQLASMDYPDLEGFTEPANAITNLQYSHTNGFLTGVTGYTSSISYYPNGAVNTIQRTNGGSDVHAADPDSIPRPRWIRAKKGGATLWYSGQYSYDGAGNVTDLTTSTGNDYFVYDGLSRLLEGTVEDGAKSQSYTFDSFGNLTSITDSQGTRTITVNTTTNRLASPATYDDAGNLTAWGGFSYEWTPTGEMRTRSGTGLSKWFGYTADGERIVSEDAITGDSTYSLRDLSGKVVRVYEKTGSTWTWGKDYVYRDGLLLATEDSSETLFFTLDHLGTPRVVTDANGDEVIEHAYYGFGEKADSNWDNEAMKFTGHERDLEGTPDAIDDLDYMHARYYNPNLGRFLSVDPVGGSIGSSQSWNRYSYVWNNPINLIDPTGEAIHVIYNRAQSGITDDEWSQIQDSVRQTFGEADVEVVFHETGSDTIPSGTDLGPNDRIQILDIEGPGSSPRTEGAHSVVSADRSKAEGSPPGGFVNLMSNVISHELGHGTGVLVNYDWHRPDRGEAGEVFKRGFQAMPLGQNFYSRGTYKGEKTVMYDETTNEFYTRRLGFSSADKTILNYYFGSTP